MPKCTQPDSYKPNIISIDKKQQKSHILKCDEFFIIPDGVKSV